MCEYCGCQDVTAVDELTREHDMVVNLIGDVRATHAATDTGRMAEPARRITAVLEPPHTQVEEEHILNEQDGVFPAALSSLKPNE
jgi:hypothetical protein